MTALAQELRTLTYTPALCSHLEDFRRSLEAQRELARNRLEGHAAVGDEDGVKIEQINLTLAGQGLNTVQQHLWRANREWTGAGRVGVGVAEVQTEVPAVSPYPRAGG